MGQIKTGKFISTGGIVNVNLGFIPAYARFLNAMAAADEVAVLEYFNKAGDASEFWHYAANAAGAVAAVITKKSADGYVSEYDTVAIGNQRSVTMDATGGAAENLLTCTNAAHVPKNGDVLKFVEGNSDIAAGVSKLLNYYVIDSEVYGAGTFRISRVAPDTGAAQTVHALTDDGTAPNYFINVSNPGVADVVGGKGVSLSASFSDDSDVIYYVAIEADRDQDLGDSANW